MKPSILRLLAFALLLPALVRAQGDSTPRHRLSAFRSDQELLVYFRALSEDHRRRMEAAAKCGGAVRVALGKSAPGGSRAAIVRGHVTDGSGEPIAGASVSVAPLGLATSSAADGRYGLTLPAARLTPPKSLTLTVRVIGYRPARHTLTVSPGDSIEVNFAPCDATVMMQGVVVTEGADQAAVRAAPSITNTQHEGVDEGGIVKLHGEHLVILRRGRLFTVAIGDHTLRPIAAVDAFGPGIDPRAAWYDELLLWDDKVVVVGYSYERGGTELGVFRLDSSGGLRHLATYQLRSNDYYSSRNYASRLIGSKLVFYAPLFLPYGLDEPLTALPAMRRWNPRAKDGFERIVAPQRVYLASDRLSLSDELALHTVTACDLATPELACEATVVIGPWGRVFYVSLSAVYVWMSPWRARGDTVRATAVVTRMPLDGSAPSALRVWGTPVDQFSFLESEDRHLNVLVRSEAHGDWMWAPEVAAGTAALLRVPLDAFGDGSRAVERSRYRHLPAPATDGSYAAFHNRFVGDHLLYGIGTGWGRPQAWNTGLFAVPVRGGPVSYIPLQHGADRIEVMGADAVVVGANEGDLHFSGIRLTGSPEVRQRYALRDASQGELRSHGFFYRVDGPSAGVLGLPVRGPGRPGYEHLFRESASVVFLRNDGWWFEALGDLEARAEGATGDGCKASCVDWYGNSRPIFIGPRVFALLGYELVEGRIERGRMREVSRTSFAPGAARLVGR
ncbi:MAG: beta-propeller domain-containing protein [Gemmatimonadales bacterium]